MDDKPSKQKKYTIGIFLASILSLSLFVYSLATHPVQNQSEALSSIEAESDSNYEATLKETVPTPQLAPTLQPTIAPTATPTIHSTTTPAPTQTPTPEPTDSPTPLPTNLPTPQPTATATPPLQPTEPPVLPTEAPNLPTEAPQPIEAPQVNSSTDEIPEQQVEKEPESQVSTPVGDTVWLSATGEKYHRINNCGRMNPDKARQVSLEYAVENGYEKCEKCY